MTPAPVGYQCPECVQAGVAATRRPTTVFGGQLGRDGAVSMSLIGICVVAYVALGMLNLAGGLDRWALQPVAIALGDQWVRLVTAMFLHSGLLHLALNMYALYLLGPPLERALGHGRFLTLYLVAGLGGSVASYTFSPLLTISVGASGAIFGLMAAWIVVHRRLNADATPIIVLLGINVVLGFLVGGIDWRAHLGGGGRRGAGRRDPHQRPRRCGSGPDGPAGIAGRACGGRTDCSHGLALESDPGPAAAADRRLSARTNPVGPGGAGVSVR